MLEINKYINFPFDQLLSLLNKDSTCGSIKVSKPVFVRAEEQNLGYTIDNISFEFQLKRNCFTNHKSIIVICSKDNGKILEYTLEKLKQTKDLYNHDILLVDDRSESHDIFDLSLKFNTSYLRIDNDANVFNYSVINNIAAAYAKYYAKEIIIFYNNDLWPSENSTLSNILDKHYRYNSTLTGCKLLYPSKAEYENLGKPPHILEKHLDQLYDTIQHGGIHFGIKMSSFIDKKRTFLSANIVLAPYHTWRFYSRNEVMASVDQRCYAVTGALHIVNTNKFIDIGGLNCTMSTSFQDIDLCVRLFKNKEPIYYLGSEHMYHAESLTHFREKMTEKPEFLSDNIMWDYTYGIELPNILGLQLRK